MPEPRIFFETSDGLSQERLGRLPASEVRHEVLFQSNPAISKSFVAPRLSVRRCLFALILPGVIISILALKAFQMQIWQGSDYQAKAESNRSRIVTLWPKRGVIYDREGQVLAENTTRFQLVVHPDELPTNQAERDRIIESIAHHANVPVEDIKAQIADESAQDAAFTIMDQIPYEEAMRIATELPTSPGMQLEIRSKRRYPLSAEIESLSHVLGYVGRISPSELDQAEPGIYRRADEIGKTGVERTYEKSLRGTIGTRRMEVDVHGRPQASLGESLAVDGTDLKLSLDADLQRIAQVELKKELDKAGIKRGAVVALDPRNGEILALVSLPAYNNNFFAGSVSSTYYAKLNNDPDHPLFPRAWSGSYPSGSTVKIVVSLAALEEKVITATTAVLSNGGIRIGQWFFPDWKAGGHGMTNVRKAISMSVNTFFYAVGGGYQSITGMGVDKLTSWYRQFGLGEKTGIDLPTEAKGFVPSKAWKEEKFDTRWFVGDTYNLSIGQGDLLVTPLQVARYTAYFANGGTLVTPHVAKDIQTTSTRLNVNPENIETVRLGMRDNVLSGSGRSLSTLPMNAAGKTGTAQWNSTKNTHAWFTSFAPFEKPEIVVTVLLEEGGEGSSVAVPVAKQILASWWQMRTERNGSF